MLCLQSNYFKDATSLLRKKDLYNGEMPCDVEQGKILEAALALSPEVDFGIGMEIVLEKLILKVLFLVVIMN